MSFDLDKIAAALTEAGIAHHAEMRGSATIYIDVPTYGMVASDFIQIPIMNADDSDHWFAVLDAIRPYVTEGAR